MTNLSWIEMAFELLKAAVMAGNYYSLGDTVSQKMKYRAKWAFDQADAFIEEAKNNVKD